MTDQPDDVTSATERARLTNDATLQRLAQRGVDASHVIHTARIVALLDLLFDDAQRQVYEHTVQAKIAEALASIEEQLAAHEARSKLLAGVNVAAPNGQQR